MRASESRELIARAAGRLFAQQGYAAPAGRRGGGADVTKTIVYATPPRRRLPGASGKARGRSADILRGCGRATRARAARPRDSRARLDYVRENQQAWLMLFVTAPGDDEIKAVRRRVSLRAAGGGRDSSHSERRTAFRRPDPAERRAARERGLAGLPVVDPQSEGQPVVVGWRADERPAL